jgi:phage terminase small subunit
MAEHLTPRIAGFVEEYLVDPIGTQAAIRAGYSAKTAAQQASRLLRNVKVQQAIATRQKRLADKRMWDAERLIDEAETNLELARSGGWRGVSPANGALELIGRVTGILSDKPREPTMPVITRVVVVLNRGLDAEGQPQVVEAAYQVLPTAPELPPEAERESSG